MRTLTLGKVGGGGVCDHAWLGGIHKVCAYQGGGHGKVYCRRLHDVYSTNRQPVRTGRGGEGKILCTYFMDAPLERPPAPVPSGGRTP